MQPVKDPDIMAPGTKLRHELSAHRTEPTGDEDPLPTLQFASLRNETSHTDQAISSFRGRQRKVGNLGDLTRAAPRERPPDRALEKGGGQQAHGVKPMLAAVGPVRTSSKSWLVSTG